MNRIRQKLWTAVLAVMLAVSGAVIADLPAFAYAADEAPFPAEIVQKLEDSYAGKTVILQTNDVHGMVTEYQYMAGLRSELKKRGADVYMVDCGDFLQGTEYVSYCKGSSAITMMNLAGYDLIIPGNHDFDYGYAQLQEYLKELKAKVICDSILDSEGSCVWERTNAIEIDGVKIGFFGVTTPETKTKSSPSHTEGLTFLDENTKPTLRGQAEEDVRKLKEEGADIVIGLSHMGTDEDSAPYRSIDLWNAVKDDGADLILDGHSHTIMTSGKDGEPIMSTGTQIQNIGMVVIDEATKSVERRELYKVASGSPSEPAVKAASDKIVDEVMKLFGQKIGITSADLNCFRDKEKVRAAGYSWTNGNRDGETNTGDLVADAFRWGALQSGELSDVKEDHVVCIINGGAIRDASAVIKAGDVTRKNILSILPFDNRVEGVYVSGAQLLEALEASTETIPEWMAGFPQVAGIDYTIDTRIKYYPREETYPNSTVKGPKYIRRVTINSVNGRAFSPKDTYVVVCNDFLADGGDTYTPFRSARRVDTGYGDLKVVVDYIQQRLGGTIGSEYAEPAGRITIRTGEAVTGPNPMTVKTTVKKVKVKTLKKKAVKVAALKVRDAEGKVTYRKMSGASWLKVNASTGKVTVKKGTKKGTYKVRVRVTAAGNEYCVKKTETVTARVKVR